MLHLSQLREEEKAEVSRSLAIIVWILLSASLLILGGLVTVPQFSGRWARLLAAIYAVCIPTLILNRRGYTRFASIFLIVGLWVLLTAAALTAGGIASLAALSYLIVIFIAGLLLGPRAAIATALLSILTALGLVFLEITGHMPAPVIPHTPMSRWISLTLLTVIMMGLQYLSVRRVHDALRQSRQELEVRRRAEDELRKSEAESRLAADAAGLGTWFWDEATNALTFDRAANVLFGFSAEKELTIEEFFTLLHPEDRDEVYRVWREAVDSGSEYQTDFRTQWSDGSTHWIAARGRFYHAETQSLPQMVGIVLDITERKQREEQLRRTSERLALATRAASIGIWDWNIARDELVWDDAMYRLVGIRKEDFGGAYDAWANSLAPEDFARVNAEVQAALRGEREFASEFRIVWPDSSIHFIKAASQTFRDEAGRPVRMVGVNYDITRRKLAEEQVNLLQKITVDVAASADLPAALEVVLRRVCEKTGWALGQAWVPRVDGTGLDCCPAWFATAASMQEFRVFSQNIILSRGSGLPGRVWESRQPLWIRDVTLDANFPQAEVARKSGLKAALAVPILSGDKVIAVLEFFLSEPREEDERLVNVIAAVAAQIGLVCARKLAEESLRLSEERFAKAFNASPEPISIFRHRDGVLLEVNERWQSVYGYTRDEAVGHTALELNKITPEDREKLRGILEKQRSLREFEVDLKTKQNEIRHISLSAEQIVVNNELCNIFLHHDITERQRAENENRKLIHHLGERVKELTALHRAARILEDETNSVPQLLQKIVALLPPAWQYPEVTAGRISFGALVFATPNFVSTQWSQMAEFTAGGVRGTLEVVYLEERPAHYIGPFQLEERNLISSLAEMISSALNRKYAQEALRESERRFSDTLTNIDMIAVMADLNGDIMFCNDYLLRLTDWKREDVIGRSWYELFLPEDEKEKVSEILDEVEPTGEVTIHLENQIKTRSGERRLVKWTNTTLRGTDGQVIGVAAFGDDITERKEAEEKLRASSDQLRALSERLRRAKEEEGIRIARELHDELGSSLTSLKWSLLGLDKAYSEDQQQSGNSSLRVKIEGMVGLVDATVTTVRRISSELRPGVLDDLGLGSAIEWHCQQFQEQTGIVCRFDSTVEIGELNREQATTVFRIFQEAMTNILRHAQATKVNIVIEEDEREFVLEIRDNGRGITENERLGIRSLGLLGMRERAHSIGGQVQINGIAGNGTVLIARFPIRSEPASKRPRPAS